MLHQALKVVALALAVAAAAAAEAKPSHVLVPVTPAKYAQDVVRPHQGKVLVVAFWASYCTPCLQELPELVKLDRARADVDLVLVSTDPKEWRDKARAALATLKIPTTGVPLYWADADDPQPFIDAVDKAWAGELPFTAIYAPDGTRALVLSGEQTVPAIEQAIASVAAARAVTGTPAR